MKVQVVSSIDHEMPSGFRLVKGQTYIVSRLWFGIIGTSVAITGMSKGESLLAQHFQTSDGKFIHLVMAVSGKALTVFGEHCLFITDTIRKPGSDELYLICRVRSQYVEQPRDCTKPFPHREFAHLSAHDLASRTVITLSNRP